MKDVLKDVRRVDRVYEAKAIVVEFLRGDGVADIGRICRAAFLADGTLIGIHDPLMDTSRSQPPVVEQQCMQAAADAARKERVDTIRAILAKATCDEGHCGAHKGVIEEMLSEAVRRLEATK